MPRTVLLRGEGGERRVTIGDDGVATIDGVAIGAKQLGRGELRVGQEAARTAWVAAAGDTRWVFLDGHAFEFEVLRAGARRRAGAGHGSLSSPMPATVVRVDVTTGASVRRGDTLVILEAMKMELPIRATSDGVVTAVHCRPGQLVQPGVSLVDIE